MPQSEVLVVKNGWKICSSVSSSIPQPLSRTDNRTYLPGTSSADAPGSSRIHLVLTHADPDDSGPRLYCLPRVDAEVHQDLLNLTGVGQNRWNRVDLGLDLHIARQRCGQQIEGLAHDDSEIMRLRRLGSVVPEAQNLLRQVTGARGGACDLAQVGVSPMLARQCELCQLDGANDRRECVLDLVSELAGDSADRFQALCVQDLILTGHALADFAEGPDAVLAGAAVVLERSSAALDQLASGQLPGPLCSGDRIETEGRDHVLHGLRLIDQSQHGVPDIRLDVQARLGADLPQAPEAIIGVCDGARVRNDNDGIAVLVAVPLEQQLIQAWIVREHAYCTRI